MPVVCVKEWKAASASLRPGLLTPEILEARVIPKSRTESALNVLTNCFCGNAPGRGRSDGSESLRWKWIVSRGFEVFLRNNILPLFKVRLYYFFPAKASMSSEPADAIEQSHSVAPGWFFFCDASQVDHQRVPDCIDVAQMTGIFDSPALVGGRTEPPTLLRFGIHRIVRQLSSKKLGKENRSWRFTPVEQRSSFGFNVAAVLGAPLCFFSYPVDANELLTSMGKWSHAG